MRDRYDNVVTCSSAAAVEHYDRAVDAHLHGWPGALDEAARAVQAAPDFALGRALHALLLNVLGRGAEARAELTAAAANGVRSDEPRAVQRRERSQVELIGAIVEGRVPDALAALERHAAEWPTDVLAASTGVGAYGLFAFSGRADHDQARLAFCESLAPHHPADFPWLLANRGWARIEAGRVDEGLALAEQALALRRHNAHNAHIVLHGLFESGRWQHSLEFLAGWLPDYPDHGILWGHLHWHGALAEIELGDTAAALARLTGPMLDYLPRGTPFMGLADVPSLLWRLALRDVAGLPWSIARQHVARHFAHGSNVFGELHLAMVAAAHADRDALSGSGRRLGVLRDRGHAGAITGWHWIQALGALLDDDPSMARTHLDACAADVARVGGSHAQRLVIRQTQDALRLPRAG